ncbi:MAG TPA: ATP-binding cassette domain-containing protein, partial [Candidatus Acidoferrales bacterium]|nr:ATP-binding cassette domain-containing protein [Candidatus Acidoferrales bacterium]
MSTLLEVSQLSAGYGDVQILWDVSLRVGDGESVAVLGANGVGKSTLLKTMAGLLRPFRGRIRWRNQDITPADPAARVRLGMSLVPEGKRLFVGMTVRENLLMGAFARRNGVEVRRDLERVLILFPALR